jgi:hypothetical protein
MIRPLPALKADMSRGQRSSLPDDSSARYFCPHFDCDHNRSVIIIIRYYNVVKPKVLYRGWPVDGNNVRDSRIAVLKITIDKAKADATPNGSCSIEGPDFRLEQIPILDVYIRVSGDHPVAFNLLFG